MFVPPSQQDIFNFTLATHGIDRIPLSAGDCDNTWNQRGLANPYAQGHFRAFMYIIHTLLPSNDFPAKDATMLATINDSDAALLWLRNLHRKMAEPLVGHDLVIDDVNAPDRFDIGRYRLKNTMGVMKQAPGASLVPAMMHNWLVDLSKLHDRIKHKVDNPYGLDKDTALEVLKKTHEINLFFCTVQPLACLNQRMGRFLENTFRVAWRMPMSFYGPNSPEYRNLTAELQEYEKTTVPLLVSKALNVK